jgi:hypothetical protein
MLTNQDPDIFRLVGSKSLIPELKSIQVVPSNHFLQGPSPLM